MPKIFSRESKYSTGFFEDILKSRGEEGAEAVSFWDIAPQELFMIIIHYVRYWEKIFVEDYDVAVNIHEFIEPITRLIQEGENLGLVNVVQEGEKPFEIEYGILMREFRDKLFLAMVNIWIGRAFYEIGLFGVDIYKKEKKSGSVFDKEMAKLIKTAIL